MQFDPLRNFGSAQLGVFWKELGSDWPFVSDAPAVDPIFEKFEFPNIWEQAALVKLSSRTDVRLQIRNATRDRMIQVQNGRFFYNWLRTSESKYPSYDVVRPGFDERWEQFREFIVSQSNDHVVRPNQWEILYVNHMPQGTLWNELCELPQILTFLNQPDCEGIEVQSDGIAGEWRFEILPRKGRLYVRLGMKVRKDGETPCVVLTLLARGQVDGECTLHDGLELGHATITNAFDRITTATAQKHWKVLNDDA